MLSALCFSLSLSLFNSSSLSIYLSLSLYKSLSFYVYYRKLKQYCKSWTYCQLCLSCPPPHSLSLFHPFSPCIYLFLYMNPKIPRYRYLVSSNTETAPTPGFMEKARAKLAPNFLVVAQQPLLKVNNIVSSVFLSLSLSFNLFNNLSISLSLSRN